MSGGLVAFFIKKNGSLSNNLISISGLVAILYSIFVFDISTPFPSQYTLIPVLGTMAIIIFANGSTLVAQILRIKISKHFKV